MKKCLSYVLATAVLMSLFAAFNLSSAAAVTPRVVPYQTSLYYYNLYAKRVTLPANKANSTYQSYLTTLATANTYFQSYGSYSRYDSSLESGWTTWRLQIPVSMGAYNMYNSIIAGISYSGVSSTQKNRFNTIQTKLIDMRDALKNNYYASDKSGQLFLDFTNTVISNMRSGSLTSTGANSTYLAARVSLFTEVLSYESEVYRDDSSPLLAATNTFIAAVDSARSTALSLTSTSSQCTTALNNLEAAKNTYQSAVKIGNAFKTQYRALYGSVSANFSDYTTESWSAVSDAVNFCDGLYTYGTVSECAAAYQMMVDAVAALERAVPDVLKVGVSSATVYAGSTVSVNVTAQSGSNLVFGSFDLFYDDRVLEFVSASGGVAAENCEGAVRFCYDNAAGITAATALTTLTFNVKPYVEAQTVALELSVNRALKARGYELTPQVTNGIITINSAVVFGDFDRSGTITTTDSRNILMYALGSLSAITDTQLYLADYDRSGGLTTTDARSSLLESLGTAVTRPSTATISFDTNGGTGVFAEISGNIRSIASLPSAIPVKSGFVFDGWYTAKGKRVSSAAYITGSETFTAGWTEFSDGKLYRDNIEIGSFVSIHCAYAVEDDFKYLAEAGVTFIILDYSRSNKALYDKCLGWAEKYGVKCLIHDYDLNAIASPTTAQVLNYTADYSSSPSFAGNNLCDEPHYNQYAALNAQSSPYMQAMNNQYDMHINLFPQGGVEAFIGTSFTNYLTWFCQQVASNHFSVDPYPLSEANGVKSTGSGYYNELQTITDIANTYDKDAWIYIQTMTGIEGRFPDMADLRFQTYATLAFGMSKIVHYCYDVPGYTPSSPNSAEVYAARDYVRGYTELYDYCKLVDNEVLAFSDAYSQFDYVDTYTYRTGTVPAYVSQIAAISGSDISVSANKCLLIGKFAAKQGGASGYLIANASELEAATNATVTFTVSGKTTVRAYIGAEVKTLTTSGGACSLTLKPGQGAFITAE